MTRHNKLILFIILFYTMNSCAPKLTFTEIEKKINENYIALSENNIEYEFKNTPVKDIKKYGEEEFREKLEKIFKLRENSKYPISISSVGDLKIQDIHKCNSTYFYNVRYLLDISQFTPYLDSIALERNYKKYGKENVHFLSNAKILETRQKKEAILIFDKDKEWKLLKFSNLDEQMYDTYFGNGFIECIQTEIDDSDYHGYW